MKLAFTLTMPGCASWNGKWSGDGKLFCQIRSIHKAETARKIQQEQPYSYRWDDGCIHKAETARKIQQEQPYSYRWDDGWMASISVKEVSAVEARKLSKASCGFCGYDWMIDRIISHGRILANHELKQEIETV